MSMRSDRPEIDKYTGKISNLSEDDKPREKVIKRGVRSLTDAELLAIVIGSGISGKSVLDLSREILAECNNDLTVLSRLTIQEMTQRFSGIGPARAVGISAALQLGSRVRESSKKNVQVRSSADVYNYVRGYIESLATEEFWIIILSRANNILRAECVSQGGTVATYVETKVVVKRALDHLASGIILAHNHPSGNLKPSANDDNLTRKIKDAAALFDIKVLDHLIVTSSGYYSYADEGRI